MINYEQVMEVRPSLIGTIAASTTAVGAPVDTQGWSNVLAVLVAGAVYGTGANAASLAVKMQESDSATSTGTAWTDVGTGQVSGTWAFTTLSWTDATDPQMKMGKKFEIVSDGIRKRYIRAHATMAGTAGSSPKYSVTFLMGNPVDTIAYVNSAALQATGNSEFTIGR